MYKKPDWLKVRYADSANRKVVEEILRKLNLNTVCNEAKCPNYKECFSHKTATFMIMGTNCTRNCMFCNVRYELPLQLNPDEPKNVAQAVKELGLKYVVVTSVTRDDLPDGGAEHFAKVIIEIKRAAPQTAIEVLIPDFMGSIESLRTVAKARPNVISHNMETVKSLYSAVRPQAIYKRSLELLRNIKLIDHDIHSKSGIMIGLGETKEQVFELFDDLLIAGCEFLTIGQYLAPTKQHYPVHEYIKPQVFEEYKTHAIQKGFKFVASAPLVRSSFNASEAIVSDS